MEVAVAVVDVDNFTPYHFAERFLMTKSCRRAILLQYFGEITEDATCQSLGGALCDNCEGVALWVPSPGESKRLQMPPWIYPTMVLPRLLQV